MVDFVGSTDRAVATPVDIDREYVRKQLSGKDFSGQALAGRVFDESDLTGANFDGSDLTNASFRNADLTRASFRGAQLEGAGFEDLHMPGADLSTAKTGDAQKKLEMRLDVAKSLAETLRSVFIASSGILAYIGATVVSASDALVLTNKTTMDLPLVSAKVSVHAFFYLSSILTLALGSYILSRVSHFARVVSRLPARLPEGPPLQEQVDPWVLACVGVFQKTNIPILRSSELTRFVSTLFEWIGARLPGLITRWMPSLVLWLLMLRYFVACRLDRAALRIDFGFAFIVLAFFGSWAIAFGLRSYSELVEGVRPLASAKQYAGAAIGLVALAIGCRFASGVNSGYGAPREVLTGSQLAGASLMSWNLAGANLENADLSSTNLGGVQLQEAQLSQADLRFATLTSACAISAVLTGANLSFAQGDRPNFADAKLEDSSLKNANLPGAIFQNAHLKGAHLNKLHAPLVLAANADFSDAILDDVQFDHGLLNGAQFSGKATLFRTSFLGADLSSTSFNSARLFGAQMQGANLTGASFIHAMISTANLSGTLLHQAFMSNMAQAWNVDLSHAILERIEMTCDPDLGLCENADMLNMSASHFNDARLLNVSFPKTDLTGAVFDNATLEFVDFGASNLTAVSFSGTTFKQIKIKAANRTGVHLSNAQLANSDLGGTP